MQSTEKKLFAVVLAAGAASRFGSVKQLEVYDDMPLVTRAVRLAESVCGPRTILVAGHEWRAVVDACRPLEGFFVNFSGYRGGMGGSIACGIRSVADTADAALLLLADQPLVTRDHLETLLSRWKDRHTGTVATTYAGSVGPPVVFPARLFGQLMQLQGDSGARAVLMGEGQGMSAVPFENAAVDIDRPKDLQDLPAEPT